MPPEARNEISTSATATPAPTRKSPVGAVSRRPSGVVVGVESDGAPPGAVTADDTVTARLPNRYPVGARAISISVWPKGAARRREPSASSGRIAAWTEGGRRRQE